MIRKGQRCIESRGKKFAVTVMRDEGDISVACARTGTDIWASALTRAEAAALRDTLSEVLA